MAGVVEGSATLTGTGTLTASGTLVIASAFPSGDVTATGSSSMESVLERIADNTGMTATNTTPNWWQKKSAWLVTTIVAVASLIVAVASLVLQLL